MFKVLPWRLEPFLELKHMAICIVLFWNYLIISFCLFTGATQFRGTPVVVEKLLWVCVVRV